MFDTIGLDERAGMAMLRQATARGANAEQAKQQVLIAAALTQGNVEQAGSFMHIAEMIQHGHPEFAKRMLGLRDVKNEGELVVAIQKRLNAGLDMEKELLKTASGQMILFEHEIRKVREQFGQLVIEAFKPAIDLMTKIVQWFKNLDDQTKKNILTFAGMTAGIIALVGAANTLKYLLATVFSGAGTMLMILAPLAVAVVAWVDKMGGVANAWEMVKAKAQEFWDWIRPAAEDAWASIKAGVVAAGTVIMGILDAVREAAASAFEGLASVDWRQVLVVTGRVLGVTVALYLTYQALAVVLGVVTTLYSLLLAPVVGVALGFVVSTAKLILYTAAWLVWKAAVAAATLVMALWTVTGVGATIKAALYNAIVLVGTVIQMAYQAALGGTTLGLILTTIAEIACAAAAVLLNIALGVLVALLAGAVVFVIVAAVAAVYALIAGFQALSSILAAFAVSGGMAEIGTMLQGWGRTISLITDLVKVDMSLAWDVAAGRFRIMVKEMGVIWDAVWDALKEGFRLTWLYMKAKFFEAMADMASNPLFEWVAKKIGGIDMDEVRANIKRMGDQIGSTVAESFSKQVEKGLNDPAVKAAEAAQHRRERAAAEVAQAIREANKEADEMAKKQKKELDLSVAITQAEKEKVNLKKVDAVLAGSAQAQAEQLAWRLKLNQGEKEAAARADEAKMRKEMEDRKEVVGPAARRAKDIKKAFEEAEKGGFKPEDTPELARLKAELEKEKARQAAAAAPGPVPGGFGAEIVAKAQAAARVFESQQKIEKLLEDIKKETEKANKRPVLEVKPVGV
jgi:hypothetical protein